MKQVTKATVNGIRFDNIVHFTLPVSFQIVYVAVPHGKCKTENNIKQIAVTVVKP